MSKSFIIFSVGKLLEILALTLLIPAGIAFFEIPSRTFPSILFDYKLLGFIIAIVSSFICGNLLKFIGSKELTGTGIREGFAIVTFGWIILTFFGAIPIFVYFISQAETLTITIGLRAFTDAYFEIMSGFTTTGATILTNVEILPRGILFWRALTQWLGGMGIIVLFVAFLPALGAGGNFLYQAEVPGPVPDRLKPRIADSAKLLWLIYCGLTALLILCLWPLGMTPYEAVCHAFTTLSTGGFSTHSQSIGFFRSVPVEMAAVFLMLLGTTNFATHHVLLTSRGRRGWKDAELRLMVLLIIVATPLAAYGLVRAGALPVPEAFHQSAFHVVSALTGTGYATAELAGWSELALFAGLPRQSPYDKYSQHDQGGCGDQ